MSIKFSKTPGNNEIRLSTDTKVQMWDPRKTKDKPVFNFHENGAGTVKFSSTQEKLFRALAGGHLCGSCDDYDNANVLTEADLKDAKKRFIDKDKSLFGDINVTEFRYDEQAGIVNLTTDKGDILRIDLLTKSEKAVQEANKKNGKTVSGQTNTTPSAPAKAKPDNTKTKPDASKKPAVKTNIQSKKNITTAKTTKNSKKADEKTQKAAAKNTTKAVQKKKEEKKAKTQLQNHKKDTEGFLLALAHRESGGNHTVMNRKGYIGLYQVGEAALHDGGVYYEDKKNANYKINDWKGYIYKNNKYGIKTLWDFRWSPPQQKAVQIDYKKKQWEYIKSYRLTRFIGKKINGQTITESGLLAGAHLVGVGGLKDYLLSGGARDTRDGNNTRVSSYISKFSYYDVREITMA